MGKQKDLQRCFVHKCSVLLPPSSALQHKLAAHSAL